MFAAPRKKKDGEID